MVGRFILCFLAVLLYMGAWSAALWVVIEFGSDEFAFLIPVIAALMILSMPLFLDFTAKRIFFFRGEGSPIDEQKLRAELLSVNVPELPIVAIENGNEIVFTWKYLDAKWWEILKKTGARESFEVVVKLDARRKRATLIDISRSIHWSAGPQGVKFGGSFFRGIFLGYSVGASWGIRENFTLGKIYQFTFDPSELHNPVMNTILRNGWDVRLGLW